MTVNQSRSERQSLIEGTYDGKYRRRRPDTEVQPGLGDHLVESNRDSLNPFWGFGYINSETTAKVSPGQMR